MHTKNAISQEIRLQAENSIQKANEDFIKKQNQELLTFAHTQEQELTSLRSLVSCHEQQQTSLQTAISTLKTEVENLKKHRSKSVPPNFRRPVSLSHLQQESEHGSSRKKFNNTANMARFYAEYGVEPELRTRSRLVPLEQDDRYVFFS